MATPLVIAVTVATIATIVAVVAVARLIALHAALATRIQGERRDAVERSASVTTGKMFEQITPYLPSFRYNPRDVRFLGSPIDLVVFDGLAGGEVEAVVFVEVKTGTSKLSKREQSVRNAIISGRVSWEEFRVSR